MGGGASKKTKIATTPSSSVQPNLTEKEAQKQIKKIERLAPRKKQESKGVLEIKVGGKQVKVPYGYVSQTGYYPDELDKANQDSFIVKDHIGEKESTAIFGVFDGHGKFGDYCSQFARDELWECLEREPGFEKGEYYEAILNAHVKTNEEMHLQEQLNNFSDMMSGTTAITALIDGDNLFVANVGDSRAIAISEGEGGRLESVPLSIDQTPFRRDERERVKQCGARVLTMSQLEGLQDPDIDDYGDEDENDGDPPRLWTKLGSYPGTAFTRSIGDRVAEEIGVNAIPEILERKITADDHYLLIASDGVFEFISSQSVVDLFSVHKNDLLNACRAIVAESYRQWLQFETRTDDITCIIVDLRNIGDQELSQDQKDKRKGSKAVLHLSEEMRLQLTNHHGNGGGNQDESGGFRSKTAARDGKGDSNRLKSVKFDDNNTFMEMELRPVRRKVANNVGVVSFDPSELDGYELPVFEKSEEEAVELRLSIQNNYLFAHLDEEQLEKAILAMEKVPVKEGDIVIKQFDKGDRFYVASTGRYSVEVAVAKMMTDANGKQIPLPGQYEPPREVMEYNCEQGFSPSFGELALMYNKPRAATITAKTEGILYALERKAFHSVLQRDTAHRLIKVLRKVKAFETLTYNEIARLVDTLGEVHYKPGQEIVRQGDAGDSFYIVKKGLASVTITNEDDETKEVMQLADYDYFGERSLLNEAPRAATVTAKTDCTCLMIKKTMFEDVLSRIRDVLEVDGKERESVAKSFSTITQIDQLKVLRGEIPFFAGMLYRCQIRETASESGTCHTLRRIILPEDEAERNETNAMLEKELECLRKIPVPMLVASFESENKLVKYQLFREDFMIDLQSVIQDRPLDPSSNMLKFSIKSIASGLIQLHQHRGILSRGVAPEGILMDIKGMLRLADFRYSKITNGVRTYTACGTPEYMSPEQVKGTGHSFASDWWSLGILLLELCNGSSPWSDKTETELYESITDPFAVQLMVGNFSRQIDASGFKLLSSLLEHDVEKRLKLTHEDDFDGIPFLARVRTKESPFMSFAQGVIRKRGNSTESFQ